MFYSIKIKERVTIMTGIIVTGHGNFPSGLLSAVELVAGGQEALKAVDFTKGMSSQELEEQLIEAASAMETDQILILADLLGGSPFNTSSMLRSKLEGKQVKVLAGVNMAMMIEAVFARGTMDLDALVQDLLTAGPEGIKDLDQLMAPEEPDFSDGL